ncbi:MAG TPA: alpha-ketoglutarate-dependent dioxygenase AlkB [Nitrososphaeraceae archaeon]|nr:alpha-ketoglutarate-dependent dioxygenase AlkB [Nitrososphaeraceae archaeon]
MNRNALNADETSNLLYKDGTAYYYGIIMPYTEANRYFDLLLKNILWKNDEVNILGKHIITNRKVAWYGDSDYLYTYSNSTRKALFWTIELAELKRLVEQVSGACFNSCFLNLYHNGTEGLGWHSDDERSLGTNAPIASLSFGAERKFSFKHKQTKRMASLVLEHGSLLVMKDVTQMYWLHSLPKSNKITQARINLTFRVMVQ